MKTFLGKTISTTDEKLFEHAKVLEKLNREQIQLLVRHAAQLSLAPTTKDELEVVDRLRSELPECQTQDLTKAVSFSRFILSLIRPNDRLEDILSDLEQSGLVNQTNHTKFESFVKAAIESEGAFRKEQRRDQAERKAGRFLKSFEWAVDLRAILAEDFDFRKADEYKPKVTDFVLVILAELELSGDRTVRFQLDERSLKILCDEVDAMKKDFDAAKKELQSKSLLPNA